MLGMTFLLFSASWSLCWTCKVSSVSTAPSFAVVPKIIPFPSAVMGRRGAVGTLQGTAVLCCFAPLCHRPPTASRWGARQRGAQCQPGMSHQLPCSTSPTRLLAEPGAVEYNAECRCPLNRVRVAVKETRAWRRQRNLVFFIFPHSLALLFPAQETTALIWFKPFFFAFLPFHPVVIFGDFDSSIVEKTAKYYPRNSASEPDIDCFCEHWRAALIGHWLDMTEINPFAPRWESSVKEKMHSCFSTSGSWWHLSHWKAKSVAKSLGKKKLLREKNGFLEKERKKNNK